MPTAGLVVHICHHKSEWGSHYPPAGAAHLPAVASCVPAILWSIVENLAKSLMKKQFY